MKQRIYKAGSWTFLSNHAHVLIAIDQNRDILLREVAHRVGITERAAQQIVADLEAGGYLQRTRVGRRNRYDVHRELPLRHPLVRGCPVGDLLGLFNGPEALSLEDGEESDGEGERQGT